MSGRPSWLCINAARLQGTPATILDTRKTVPGMRLLDKWAVKTGGGENHRIGALRRAAQGRSWRPK